MFNYVFGNKITNYNTVNILYLDYFMMYASETPNHS